MLCVWVDFVFVILGCCYIGFGGRHLCLYEVFGSLMGWGVCPSRVASDGVPISSHCDGGLYVFFVCSSCL